MEPSTPMILSRVFSWAQVFSCGFIASRRPMAENCSSLSETRTPWRRLRTVTLCERETMSSSLPSRTSLSAVSWFFRRFIRAKVTLSPFFLVRFSLTWMMAFSFVPMMSAKSTSSMYSTKNSSSHCWTVRPVAARVSAMAWLPSQG